jgi:glycosyltransferase involved in cell wall biosynthesis
VSGRGVLWIGRMIFVPDLRVREVELARHVATRAPVFALDRSDALPAKDRSLAGRVRLRWRLRMTEVGVIEEGAMTRFRMPLWAANGPVFNRMAAALNERRIAGLVRKFGCAAVYHSSPFYFMPELPIRRPYHVHFDLIDNFYDEWSGQTLLGRTRRAFLREAMRRSDTLSACSLSLCERARELTGKETLHAPNGAARAELLACPPHRAQHVREKLGLQGRYVVGFICNHEVHFDGMEMLLDAWAQAFARRPDLALMIVGRGSDRLVGSRGLGPREGVHVVGPVPSAEVAAYFHACDAGLMPFRLLPVTHDALPINVVEFSTCCKPVLCNPLRELKRLAWPNLNFVEPDASAWAAALANPNAFAPFDRAALTEMVSVCDWEKSAEALCGTMGIV